MNTTAEELAFAPEGHLIVNGAGTILAANAAAAKILGTRIPVGGIVWEPLGRYARGPERLELEAAIAGPEPKILILRTSRSGIKVEVAPSKRAIHLCFEQLDAPQFSAAEARMLELI